MALMGRQNYRKNMAKRNLPDGRHIASGTSSWLILDQTTRRVQRPDNILSSFNPNLHPEASPLRYATKLEQTAESGIVSLPFKVKVSDIDLNLHTNNVQYLKWACDTYGIDFVIKNIPKSAEINYLAESVFEEDIVIKTSAEQGNSSFYNHSIYRFEDRKELCRIRIEWIEGNVNLR
jgi:medium-chain acyl-[acyl-carrier-protein] hydrolase